ncbi:MAG: hypothetical protein B7X39_20900 [Lysobacterales bacterium 14-68-21]|jgi:hypothetical protein|nr:MAG: hypothetical protein B7X39_20900 [Xanthomonadales bacterium 14-68-21]
MLECTDINPLSDEEETMRGPVVDTKSPQTTAEEASEALRRELLARGWPTSQEVGHANANESDTGALWAKDKRDRGELLGVWSAEEHGYRHPSFQFTSEGRLLPQVKDLLAAMAEHPDFQPDNDPGGWARAFWLHGATFAVAGSDQRARVPAEVFVEDPEIVIAAVALRNEGAAW